MRNHCPLDADPPGRKRDSGHVAQICHPLKFSKLLLSHHNLRKPSARRYNGRSGQPDLKRGPSSADSVSGCSEKAGRRFATDAMDANIKDRSRRESRHARPCADLPRGSSGQAMRSPRRARSPRRFRTGGTNSTDARSRFPRAIPDRTRYRSGSGIPRWTSRANDRAPYLFPFLPTNRPIPCVIPNR